MKKLSIIAVAVAFVCSLGAISCSKDKDTDIEYQKWTLTADNPLTITEMSHDPSAAYPVNFTVKLEDGQIVIVNGSAYPTEEAQTHNLPNNLYASAATIADFGEVKGLSKVDEYPAADAFATSQVAALEHGYVIEGHGAANISSYGIEALQDPKSVYMRIWIEQEVEGGFDIRYEVPFVVEEK